MAAGAVSQRKSHDIVILSFCNIVKGQATYVLNNNFFIFAVYSNGTSRKLFSIRTFVTFIFIE